MLKQLVDSLKGRDNASTFHPGQFNDPVAQLTEWSPAKRGGANFKTHVLKPVHAQRMEFRCSIGMVLFSGLFLAVGIGLLVAAANNYLNKGSDSSESIILPVVGLIFGGAGGFMLWSSLTPRVFDLAHGYYCCSRKKPEQMMDPSQVKDYVLLQDVHALQLISEYVRGSGKNSRSYYSYELNLVLGDGKRINVTDHGSINAMRRDAQQLAEFLGKPLWDAG